MASKYLATTSGSLTWSTAANWSDGVVPAASDTVTIGNSSATLDLGLNQSAITLASLAIPMTFTGAAGLAVQAWQSITSITRSGTTATLTKTAHGYVAGDVVEVRGATQGDYNGVWTITNVAANTFDYVMANDPGASASTTTALVMRKYDKLRVGVTALRIGDSGGGASNAAGSGRLNLDLVTVATAITIVNTKSTGTDSNLEPVRIIATHTSNTYTSDGGLVGIATSTPTETSTFATLNITGGKTNCGAGLTWVTVNQTGGTLNLNSGGTIIVQGGGVMTINGAGTITNATFAGTIHLNIRKATAGDTVTGTLQLMSGAVLDLSDNPSVISVGTLRISGTGISIRRNKSAPGNLSWTTLTQDPGSTFAFE